MPANEQTWRSQKTSHIVFGVSTLVMLIATIWMMGKDHVREWKGYQLQYRDVSSWTDQARVEQATVLNQVKLERQRAELRAVRSEPISPDLIESFKTNLRREVYRLEKGEVTDASPAELAELYPQTGNSLDAYVEELNAAATRVAELRAIRAEKQSAMDEAVEARQSADPPTDAQVEDATAATVAFHEADAELVAAEDEAMDARQRLLSELNSFDREANRREDELLTSKKFKAAEHTAAVSLLGIAIDAGEPEAQIALKQRKINALKAEMDDLDAQLAAANDYRIALESLIRNDIRGGELAAEKRVGETESALNLLREKLKGTWARAGDRIVRSPVLDAFNNTDLRIDQIWLPDMKIDYNFSEVARFDRCITCHRAIGKTAPGSATEPLYPNVSEEERKRGRVVSLQTPEDPPTEADVIAAIGGEEDSTDFSPLNWKLKAAYGFMLAPFGQLDDNDVAVMFVVPDSPAARSGIRMGDVIHQFGDARVRSATTCTSTCLARRWTGDSRSS